MSENQPETFANDLLRHLQPEGRPNRPATRKALGDVDQIGPDQIEEWIRWATDSGLVEATGGGRYNSPRAGQGIVGPPNNTT